MSKKQRRRIERLEDRNRELEYRWHEERDRRYGEVNAERGLALQLSREQQRRQDEKNEQLLEHILEKLGQCTTHDDFEAFRKEREQTLKPLMEFVAAERGRSTGSDSMRNLFLGVGGLLISAATAFIMWLALGYKH
jgi:hypothetical protein